jgi:trehalose synthase
MHEVSVGTRDLERFAEVLDEERFAALQRTAQRGRELLGGQTIWSVNSTARGGGVAEMLVPMLAYCRGAGVNARWAVLEGDPEFFAVTKRLHHRLHGMAGDGGPLGDGERAIYERAQDRNAEELLALVQPGDVVLVHDPQPAGLIGRLADHGATVVWRLHIGSDLDNDLVEEAWDFLVPYVEPAHVCVFSRDAYVWPMLDRDRTAVIPPSIDAFSPKNQDIDPAACRAILATTGLVAADGDGAEAGFLRNDDSEGIVKTPARLDEDGQVPADAPLIVQVSRWDPLKDPVGVIQGFATRADALEGVHLMLAGPDVSAVTDDPEGQQVFDEVRARRESLDEGLRARIHLASLSMDDVEENAATVNALQRHATIVVQKSLAEGFGLTVAEALWKSRPMVASRVGGIQDQIDDGKTGLLLDDPRDPERFGDALLDLVNDYDRARELGENGREAVREHFLESRHLTDWVELLERLGQ